MYPEGAQVLIGLRLNTTTFIIIGRRQIEAKIKILINKYLQKTSSEKFENFIQFHHFFLLDTWDQI